MNHDQALQALPELMGGRLDAGEAAELAGHLAGCPECAEARATLELLAQAPRSAYEEAQLPHPKAAEIVDFALGHESLPADLRRRLGDHIQQCAVCAGEVETVRAAEAQQRHGDADSGSSARPHSKVTWDPVIWLGLAAALLLTGVLIGMGLAGINGNFQQQVGAGGGTLAVGPAGSAVSLVLLQSPTRGPEGPPVVQARPGQDVLVLGVEFGHAQAEVQHGTLEIAVHGSGQAVSWQHELPLADAAARAAPAGILAVVVPTAALAPGPLRLEMHVRQGGTRRLLATFPFELRGGPAGQSGSPAPMNAPQK